MKCFLLPFAMLSVLAADGARAEPRLRASDCAPVSNSEQAQALDRRAESGQRRAAFCLAVGLRSLDGGELEDALVALGLYGDRHPADLLALTHRGVLSKRSLTDAVGMLPLSLADDPTAQLKAMEARRYRFRRVVALELASERRIAMQAGESALREIRAHLGADRTSP